MDIKENIVEAIGGTPLVRLTRVVPEGSAEVWLKLESGNPTGSYKDRMAVSVISAALARGDIRPGDRVVEYTGGSTGMAPESSSTLITVSSCPIGFLHRRTKVRSQSGINAAGAPRPVATYSRSRCSARYPCGETPA